MKVFLIGFILLFSLTAFAQNQPPPFQIEDIKANVRQLLSSEKIQDQAWAAYFIGKFRWAEFTPELKKFLVREDGVSIEYLHRATLDALIQLNALVRADVLLPHFNRFPDQVVILLSSDPIGNERTFLSLLELRPSEGHWLALCNLLVQQRSKGLATKLLRELYINASIVVAEKRNYGLAGMAGPYACDLGIIAVPLGLPPIVDYLLTDAKRKGSVVLAVGRHTVYYTRGEQQIDKGFTDGGGCSRHENKARYRVEYLSELLGTTPKELNFSATPSYRIIWGGAQNYRREVLRIRKEIRKSYNHLLAQLIDADMLTEQEANELAPHIEFQVNDIRKDQSIALPKI